MLTAFLADVTRVHGVLQQKVIAAVSNAIDKLGEAGGRGDSVGEVGGRGDSVGEVGGRGGKLEGEVRVDVVVPGLRHFDGTVVEDDGSAVVLFGWLCRFQWDLVRSVHL